MKLFGRKSDEQQPVVPQLEQYYAEEPKWKLWVRRIVAVLVVLLIVFAIGWAAWAVYNRVTDDGVDESDTNTGSSQNESGASQDTDGGEDSDTTTGDSSSDTSGDSDNSDDSATGGGTSNSGQNRGGATVPAAGDASGNESYTMPKTGPADTVLIVAGAALVGALGHYTVSRRALRR